MTIPEILKALRQWWWILLLCPILAAASAYLVSSSMTRIYESESTVIIEHQMVEGVSDLQSIQAAERRTQTLTQLVETRSVLEPVIDRLNLEHSVDDLRSMISVSHVRDTQLVSISVQDSDPDQAAEIANEITAEFRQYVREIQAPALSDGGSDISDTIEQVEARIVTMQERISDLEAGDGPATEAEADELAQLQDMVVQFDQSLGILQSIESSASGVESTAGSQVYAVEPAAASASPVSPRVLFNMVLATFLGGLLGAGLFVGVAWLDDNVKTDQDVRRLVDRPLIGTVPQEHLPDQMESLHSGRSISGEIFRGLRTNLQFTMVDRNIKSIVVTSAAPGEGKTTIAANLAIVLAQGGQRVILVDADMRRPRLHNLFHRVRNDRGLSNLLLQSPAVIENVIQSTTINNLKVVSTGPLPPNPPDLLGSARMRALVSALEESADIVVFDSPPVAISESLILSSLTDGVLFVIRAGKLRTGELADGIATLSQSGVPILGVVLNGVRRDSQAAYRVYQQYYPLVSDNEEGMPASRSRLSWLTRVFGRSA